MTRKWFEYYVNSPPFQSAEFFFTANRFESYPTYDADLTILDYPIWDKTKALHFGISPIFSYTYMYPRKLLFLYNKIPYPAYFEYIGGISKHERSDY